jgi:hypothetical protein
MSSSWGQEKQGEERKERDNKMDNAQAVASLINTFGVAAQISARKGNYWCAFHLFVQWLSLTFVQVPGTWLCLV